MKKNEVAIEGARGDNYCQINHIKGQKMDHFNMNYTSDRVFKIWAYTVSHCILLLRSSQLYYDVEGYTPSMNFNIDVEFWGVGFLDLPDMLSGIIIKEIRSNIPEKFNYYSSSLGYKAFEIQSKGQSFYIIAAGCRIGRNRWGIENRVSNPMLEYDEILAFF